MSRIQFFFILLFLVYHVKNAVLFPSHSLSIRSSMQFIFQHLFLVYHIKDTDLFPPLIPCLSCQVCSSFSITYSLFIMSGMQSFFPPHVHCWRYSSFSTLCSFSISSRIQSFFTTYTCRSLMSRIVSVNETALSLSVMSGMQFFFQHLFKYEVLFLTLVPSIHVSCQGYSSFTTTCTLSMSRIQSFSTICSLSIMSGMQFVFQHLFKYVVLLPWLVPCQCSYFSTKWRFPGVPMMTQY